MKRAVIVFSAAMLAAGTQSFAATLPVNEPAAMTAPNKGEVSAMTKDFITEAALGGLYEVEASKIAVDRAKSLDIKKFAQLMVDDHTKAWAALKAAVASAGLETTLVPTSLDAAHERKIKELRDEKEKDFDAEYIDEQEDAHEKTVALFRTYAQNGDVTDLKDYAAKTLPTLEAHHKAATELDKTVD